jgi:hypothetical protein
MKEAMATQVKIYHHRRDVKVLLIHQVLRTTAKYNKKHSYRSETALARKQCKGKTVGS